MYKKVKNMPNHRLPKQSLNVGCKLQKTNKRKILSDGWVSDNMRWFKRLKSRRSIGALRYYYEACDDRG